jgi:carotenoid cleavage oxygenase
MGNRYLEGNFAPVGAEHTASGLTVTGHLPRHLDGRFLRNGPNPVSEVDPSTYHWFMGDGMVHGVRLRDGRADWYRNRWVRGPRVSAELGEHPRDARACASASFPAGNTNVVVHNGRTIALIEGGAGCHELSDELDTLGAFDFDGTLPGGYTAHPLRDPVTGELHAVSYFFGRGRSVRYSVIDAAGRTRRTVDIEVTGSPMMHSFSLTEKYVVLYDLPVTFDAEQAATMLVPAPTSLRPAQQLVLSAVAGQVRVPDPITATRMHAQSLPYRWNREYPARIGLMPRAGSAGDVRWFEVDPCYVFHPVNAYDCPVTGSVVLDVVRHDRTFDTDRTGPYEGLPTLDRWTVDVAAGRVDSRRLDDRGQEFPRLDERLLGRRHRFAYTMGVHADGTPSDVLLKHDLDTGTCDTHSFGRGRQLGEFVFVPNGPDATEDDGVLMGYVYDRATDLSDLAVLDAATLDLMATVHLPTRVPHGFHGTWSATP